MIMRYCKQTVKALPKLGVLGLSGSIVWAGVSWGAPFVVGMGVVYMVCCLVMVRLK